MVTDSNLKCPYCHGNMRYYTHGIHGSTQIAYFVCPGCKAKTPRVTKEMQPVNHRFSLADLYDQAEKAARIGTDYLKAVTETAWEEREVTELETAANLQLYLKDICDNNPTVYREMESVFAGEFADGARRRIGWLRTFYPHLYDDLMEKYSGMPGYTFGG